MGHITSAADQGLAKVAFLDIQQKDHFVTKTAKLINGTVAKLALSAFALLATVFYSILIVATSPLALLSKKQFVVLKDHVLVSAKASLRAFKAIASPSAKKTFYSKWKPDFEFTSRAKIGSFLLSNAHTIAALTVLGLSLYFFDNATSFENSNTSTLPAIRSFIGPYNYEIPFVNVKTENLIWGLGFVAPLYVINKLSHYLELGCKRPMLATLAQSITILGSHHLSIPQVSIPASLLAAIVLDIPTGANLFRFMKQPLTPELSWATSSGFATLIGKIAIPLIVQKGLISSMQKVSIYLCDTGIRLKGTTLTYRDVKNYLSFQKAS